MTLLLPLLVACTDSKDADTAAAETPTVEFLTPLDGETVAAGDVSVSLIVEHFLLQDPAKHNEGEPEGWLALSVTQGDATDEIQTGETNLTVSLVPGPATLKADLYFADGDEIGEAFEDFGPASASITVE